MYTETVSDMKKTLNGYKTNIQNVIYEAYTGACLIIPLIDIRYPFDSVFSFCIAKSYAKVHDL